MPQVKKTVEVDGVEYRLRKLSWKSLEKAREARVISQAGPLRAYGGDVVAALRSEALDEAAKQLAAKQEDPAAKAKARYDSYDKGTVLTSGIEGCSAAEGKELPSHIDNLYEEPADELHRLILDMSLPPLDPAEAEAEGKGSSASSTAS